MGWRLLLEKYIIQFTRKMKIRNKILILYGIIVLVPTVFLAIGAGYLAFESTQKNYLITINEAVRQTAQNIEFRKQSYDLLAIRTATDGELISRLSKDYEDMITQLDSVRYIDRSFYYTSRYLPGIVDFRIYHTNPTLVQDGQLIWKPESRMISGLIEEEWYSKSVETAKSLTWTKATNNRDQIIVTQKIVNNYGGIRGIIYMLLDYHVVFGEQFENPFNGSGSLYLVDEEGIIIASSDLEQVGMNVSSSDIGDMWNDPRRSESFMVDGKLLIIRPLDSGWTVAANINMEHMEKQSRTILYGIVGITILFLLLSTFLVITVVKNIVWRIRKLGNRMNDISLGEFDVSVKSTSKDELGDLELLFNLMSSRLGKLVEDNTRANLKEREQSFMALQAQINPHFIYNSLSLLRWRAMDMQDEKQIRTIDALTTFYRFALNNKVNVTPIREELEHVKAYLEVQELRYPGSIHMEWHVDDDILEHYTIKLLLQPIVENCYLHGNITRKQDALIRISVWKQDENIHFEVFDNGKGISKEMLMQIRNNNLVGLGNGFGTANIRERLHLYFGEKSTFSMDSIEDEWTTVSIVIPTCSERPEIRKGGLQ